MLWQQLQAGAHVLYRQHKQLQGGNSHWQQQLVPAFTVTAAVECCKQGLQGLDTGAQLACMHVQLLQAAAAGAEVLLVIIGWVCKLC
jgi:hypothetical protein